MRIIKQWRANWIMKQTSRVYSILVEVAPQVKLFTLGHLLPKKSKYSSMLFESVKIVFFEVEPRVRRHHAPSKQTKSRRFPTR